MKLQGRNLSLRMQGEDVKLLQSELRQLGFTVDTREGFFGVATRQAVIDFQAQHGLQATGVVDARTVEQIDAAISALPSAVGPLPPPPKPVPLPTQFTIHGQVRQADGTVLVGGMVRAVDKGLLGEVPLGQATTDNAGQYEIKYNASQLPPAKKGMADLIVQVLDAAGKVLVSSQTIFNVQQDQTVNLMVGGGLYKGPSTHEQHLTELTPLLQGVPLANLKEEDIAFLVDRTSIDPQNIAHISIAARLAQEANHPNLPPEIFYAFFREGLPSDLPSLLAQSPQVQRAALETALKDNIIPLTLRDTLDQSMAALSQLIIDQAFKSPGEGRASLSDLLGTVVKDEVNQRTFLTLYVNHKGSIEDFWTSLRANPAFKDQVDNLQLTLQLGILTQNHLPLVKEIQRQRQAHEINSLRELAKYDADDWKRIIGKQVGRQVIGFPPDVPGTSDPEKLNNYAKVMMRMMEDAFPTAVVAYRAQKDASRNSADVRTFFNNILNTNTDFDLRHKNIYQFLNTNPAALNGVANKAQLAQELKSRQRVSKLAPSDGMIALVSVGINSAHAITRMSRDTFEREYSQALGGVAQARTTYENAAQVSATALHLLASYGAQFNRIDLQVLPKFQVLPQSQVVSQSMALGAAAPLVESIPDWATLFGSLDLCDCEHCRSVYSPAAYLVDVVHFLNDRHLVDAITRDAQGNIISITYKDKSAKGALFERRADLGEIELTCENTNTPLPYVDLVNEVLENAIAPFAPFTLAPTLESDLDNRHLSQALQETFTPVLSPKATIVVVKPPGNYWQICDTALAYSVKKEAGNLHVVSRSLQTSGTPQELAANPQYLNTDTYDTLRQQMYPWSLPFNLWAEEARAYLGHLGIQRYQIMETFLPGDRASLLANADLAHEYLGITSAEAAVITGATTSQPGTADPGVWNLWGFGKATLDAQNRIPDPADSTNWITSGNWLDVLTQRADVFLQQSGLQGKELLELPEIYYLNPLTNGSRQISIAPSDPNDPATCDPAKLKVVGVDQATAAKITRFVRLWRKLGWTMRDLDKAITALHPTDINDAFLTQLSHLKRLHDGLGLPVVNLLCFWALLDTAAYVDRNAEGQPEVPSLYAQLFRNKTVTNPLDPAFPENAEGFSGKLSEHVATITAALEISAEDFSLLINDADVIPTIPDPNDPAKTIPDDRLTLDYLSRLCRHATLTKALKLPARAYLSTLKLVNKDPFATTADTILFVERVGKVRNSGFSIADLDYLLRHQFVASSRIAPTEESIALILAEIRSGLQRIAADNIFAPDATGELTQKKLAILLKSDDVTKAMALLNGTATDTQAVQEAFVDHHFSTEVVFAEFLPDTADAKAKLVGPPPTITEKDERFAYVLQPLLGYIRRTLSESLVKQKLSEALKLDTGTTEQLLTQWVKSPAHPAQKSMDEFLSDAFADSDPQMKLTASGFPDQFNTFTRLHKIALVIVRFKITQEQLTWLFDYGPGVGWLDLNTLPLVPAVLSPAMFAAWARLVDLFQSRDALPLGEAVLSDIFRMARDTTTTETVLLQQLSERTEWNEGDLQFLAGTQAFSFTFPAEYKDERVMVRLTACFAMMKRLGVSAEQCRAWAKPDLMNDDARSIKQAAKAKYDDEQWLTIAKPLRDVLREKQRAALVSYLVAHPDPTKGQAWKDAKDLSTHFLIDVEMDPCMMTSRIKQALSSTQLFVQRCLMNLEQEVAANAEVDEKWREWKWMKNYRVWEANRKVFLYPENWIEPELRDDKSPFFKDLENELLQSDVTIDTAETAFLNYLEKLDAVAQLEICGMYHQVEKDLQGNTAMDILHVFGRTHNTPHVYYYRQWVDSAHWTAWEKVDLDIEGDHLIPVVWNRRLYLFWPIFTEKQEEKDITMPATGEAIEKGKKYWEIQIAWSEYKNKKWSTKKISKEKAEISPSVEKKRISSDVAFENGDLNLSLKYSVPAGSLFDQEITTTTSHEVATTTIYELRFRFVGCEDKVDVSSDAANGSLLLLPGTQQEFSSFVHTPVRKTGDRNQLTLAELDSTGHDLNFSPTLDATPRKFRVSPEQFQRFDAHAPLFYSDDTRTFFVVPQEELIPIRDWPVMNGVGPDMIERVRDYYYAGLTQTARIITPVLDGGDPLVREQTYPIEASLPGVQNSRSLTTGLGPSDGSTGSTVLAGGIGIPRIPIDGNPLLPTYHWVRPYRFQIFDHPYACLFVRELNRAGIDGLLQRPMQIAPQIFLNPPQAFDFSVTYKPEPLVVLQPYPQEDVDFSHGGAYSLYNWELFFHVPLLIANRLKNNQRFEEAQKWFHYIFDPTDTSALDVPQKYWRTRPFYDTAKPEYLKQQIENLLKRLASDQPDSDQPDTELENQVNEWRTHPFNPHLIARLRTTAYQKTVVMKYIDNLIAWGDQLFRRDTIESINEAAQLYILAAETLGRRPENIPPRAAPQVQTYNSLEPKLLHPDDFSDPLVAIENLVPAPQPNGAVSPAAQPPLTLPLYFCVAKNDKLVGYWDKVADRLFKIRHCRNIEGVVRQLPLFEPPIEPGLLMRAAAAGVDIVSALNDISAALPHYRFNVMAQKASELCADLKALGGALLSALEKRDAEVLALLRSTQEIQVLNAVRQVREKQIEEAKQALEGMKKSRDVVTIRHTYYANIQFMNPAEIAHLTLVGSSLYFQIAHAGMYSLARGIHLVPNVKIGAVTSLGATYGGGNLGPAAQAYATYLDSKASILNTIGSMSATLGGHQRRFDDWKLQERLAAKELEQMEKQIIAAEIRLAIAERELQNHDLQVENAIEVDTYMHEKFTNRELYDWMVSQISGIYFQSYQLVYDVAKRTERAYRYELSLEDSNFVQFGYWDSLKKGLLAGERLYHDLKRMEVAYLDQNKREYELTKHISLVMLDPIALVKLKETGQCFIDLPESLFDMDYPGHYMRRIKSVSLTIPCVTGPYTSVNCTLTLLKNSTRKDTATGPQYARNTDGSGVPADDPRFVDNIGAIQSIATSSAQNDSGVFELNFRDERYLPFEGSGVVSEWQLQLPDDVRQFDYDTISDVILHLRYTAREGGSLLRNGAVANLKTHIEQGQGAGSVRLFSVRHEFPTEWAKFQSQTPGANQRFELAINLRAEHYPFWSQGRLESVMRVDLLARSTKDPVPSSMDVFDNADKTNATAKKDTLAKDTALGNLLVGQLTGGATGIALPQKPVGEIKLFFDERTVADVWIAVTWSSS